MSNNLRTEMFDKINENHNNEVALKNARLISQAKADELKKRDRKAKITVALLFLAVTTLFALGNRVIHDAWIAQGSPTVPMTGSAGEVIVNEAGVEITIPDEPTLIEGIEILVENAGRDK